VGGGALLSTEQEDKESKEEKYKYLFPDTEELKMRLLSTSVCQY
jgi:hypothetical protein